MFDVTRANRIYKHFSLIPRLDVPEQHIELEDWQKFDLGCLMGWVHKRYRQAALPPGGYTRIARGHAKTTLAAGLANYFMLGDAMYPPGQPEYAQFEMQPQINIVAVDRAQGNIARGDIADMARATQAFLKRLSVKNTYIRHKVRGRVSRSLSHATRTTRTADALPSSSPKNGTRTSTARCMTWQCRERQKAPVP